MRSHFKKLLVPTPDESKSAENSIRVLSRIRTRSSKIELRATSSTGDVEQVVLPDQTVKLLVEILEQTARGNAVSVLPVRQELTTQEAADLLNVSRPFLVGLLEKHQLPFRKVGSHRRVPLSALIAYKNKSDIAREKALDELAAEAQELKLGY